MKKQFLVLVLTLTAAILGDGKSTKLVTSWKNPEYSGPAFHRILVLGMSAKPGVRADFEDALSKLVTRDGVEAVPGNKVDKSITYVPGQPYMPYPYYGSFYGYYGAVYPVVYSPDYLREDTTVRVETNVYAVTSGEGQLVWTGVSDTFNPSSADKVIDALSKLIVKELQKEAII